MMPSVWLASQPQFWALIRPNTSRKRPPDSAAIPGTSRPWATDAGLRELLTTAFPSSSLIEQRTAEAVDQLRTLMARAQQDGDLRSDVTPADLVIMLMANAGVVGATADSAPDAWRRLRR